MESHLREQVDEGGLICQVQMSERGLLHSTGAKVISSLKSRHCRNHTESGHASE